MRNVVGFWPVSRDATTMKSDGVKRTHNTSRESFIQTYYALARKKYE